MTRQIARLIDQLEVDPWRQSVGFSEDLGPVQRSICGADATDEQRQAILNDWIARSQPCLFGRMAAKRGFLRYCIVPEDILLDSDEAVRDRIQTARTNWTRDGADGKCSGFILLAVSERIAAAKPDETLMQLACRLCSLYLLDQITPDQVYHDRLDLDKPGPDRVRWTWKAGVNYFSSQGDQRWWHDHRIPGGIAFSTNSVGHMVKSGILATLMRETDAALGVDAEDWSLSKVDSLNKALVLALRTIENASDAVSGRATELLSLPIGTEHASRHVEGLPKSLVGKDTTQYLGHYHTDVTVPSEFFRMDVQRPRDLQPHVLDLTYLFDVSVDNPDHITMGTGQRIRHGENQVVADGANFDSRRWRIDGDVTIRDH